MQPGDGILWPEAAAPRVAAACQAWCPTPWALAQMKRADVRAHDAPSPAVLRQVNHRRFAHSLGQALPLAQMVDDHASLLEVLRNRYRALASITLEDNWLMKKPLGYAGRGRQKIKPGGELNAADKVSCSEYGSEFGRHERLKWCIDAGGLWRSKPGERRGIRQTAKVSWGEGVAGSCGGIETPVGLHRR